MTNPMPTDGTTGEAEGLTRADAAARTICAARCGYRGEPACWAVSGPWPNPECDEPGCIAEGRLVAGALPDRGEECKRLRAAAHEALVFIEDEAENRSAAGAEMSDYEREPREIAERLASALQAGGSQ